MRNDAVALDRALELGLPCFPCRNTPGAPETDKTPLVARGFKAASDDPAEIRKMFSRHPGCLIGVPTGEVSGIDVLDVDPRHNGNVWYAGNKAKLPPTRIHRTRRGGLHRLFRHMDGLRNTTAKIAAGIDTRAEGGYFIWWPAIGLEFQDYPPAGLPEWPQWLVELTKPREDPAVAAPVRYGEHSPRVLRAVEGIVRTIASAGQGERNSLTYWGACRMREMVAAGLIGLALAHDLLFEAASITGLPAWEIKTAIASAFRGCGHG
jgi:hypothetical protein